jgi:hypothetical protein
MKYTITSLALAAISMASPVPDSAQSPSSFKITNVVSGGSGCPQGSIDVSYTDSAVLPICKVLPPIRSTRAERIADFGKDFTASVGPSVSADASRKNCQINIALSYSPGFQYAVFSADYAGYGDLDSGVKGWMKSNYYFSGEQNQVYSFSHTSTSQISIVCLWSTTDIHRPQHPLAFKVHSMANIPNMTTWTWLSGARAAAPQP